MEKEYLEEHVGFTIANEALLVERVSSKKVSKKNTHHFEKS